MLPAFTTDSAHPTKVCASSTVASSLSPTTSTDDGICPMALERHWYGTDAPFDDLPTSAMQYEGGYGDERSSFDSVEVEPVGSNWAWEAGQRYEQAVECGGSLDQRAQPWYPATGAPSSLAATDSTSFALSNAAPHFIPHASSAYSSEYSSPYTVTSSSNSSSAYPTPQCDTSTLPSTSYISASSSGLSTPQITSYEYEESLRAIRKWMTQYPAAYDHPQHTIGSNNFPSSTSSHYETYPGYPSHSRAQNMNHDAYYQSQDYSHHTPYVPAPSSQAWTPTFSHFAPYHPPTSEQQTSSNTRTFYQPDWNSTSPNTPSHYSPSPHSRQHSFASSSSTSSSTSKYASAPHHQQPIINNHLSSPTKRKASHPFPIPNPSISTSLASSQPQPQPHPTSRQIRRFSSTPSHLSSSSAHNKLVNPPPQQRRPSHSSSSSTPSSLYQHTLPQSSGDIMQRTPLDFSMVATRGVIEGKGSGRFEEDEQAMRSGGTTCSMFDQNWKREREFGGGVGEQFLSNQMRERTGMSGASGKMGWDGAVEEGRGGGSTRESAWLESGVGGMRLGSFLEGGWPAGETQMKVEQKVATAMDGPRGDALRAEIVQYLGAVNRLELGERTVLILTLKVAQKSYNNEHRFLLPQPTALLLGTSWWSEPLSTSSQPSQNEASPLISISMSTDPGPRPPLDPIWLTNSGALLSPTTTPPVNNVQPIIAGRAIAKTLAINLPVEFSKLSTVHALVTIVAPGSEEVPLQERLIGTFKSKPISIISKPPSKARVVDIKTGAGAIHHGALITLYTRIKACQGHTRYLGISSSSTVFPQTDYRAMTGGQSRSFSSSGEKEVEQVGFVSKVGEWDAFVIYAVEVGKKEVEEGEGGRKEAFVEGYPAPPDEVVELDRGRPQVLFYNQPVVLQLSQPESSRRIETNSIAIGGGSLSSYSPPSLATSSPFSALRDEALGEPVSQHRTMCLELYDEEGREEDRFLATTEEGVKFLKSRDGRRYVDVSSGEGKEDEELVDERRRSEGGGRGGKMGVSSSQGQTRGKRARKTVSSEQLGGDHMSSIRQGSIQDVPTSLVRRRVQSVGNVRSGSTTEERKKMWKVHCGDNCAWTIVPVDLARHTFYVPPSVVPAASSLATTSHPCAQAPPFLPCPIAIDYPQILEYDPPTSSQPLITFYGTSFSPSDTVYIGTWPAPYMIPQSSSVILVPPPPMATEESLTLLAGGVRGRRVSVVREDGVVFPSLVVYEE